MFNIFKSFKTNVKTISLHTVNIVLTLTTLLYMVSIYGFDHMNKENILNFMIGTGFVVFILTILVTVIAFVLYVAFKITAKKINSNIDLIVSQVQENLNNKGKAQED